MKQDASIIFSKGLREYDFGEGHPFRGDRYQIFQKFLSESLPAAGRYDLMGAEPVSDRELLKIGSQEYIDFSRNFFNAQESSHQITGSFSRFQSGDNIPKNHHGRLEDAARLIIGQAKQACDLISSGDYDKVISIGGGLHHAKPNYGEGFCIYSGQGFG